MGQKHFDWKPVFLESLRAMPIVANACRAVGIERSTAYRARLDDEAFAKAWEDAMEDGVDAAEAEAFRRGVVGYDEPLVYQGQITYQTEQYKDENGELQVRFKLDPEGNRIPLTIKRHSDMLLSLVLKGRRKKVYADRVEHTGADGGPVATADETTRAARLAHLIEQARLRKEAEDLG